MAESILKCITVDDEPGSLRILERYISQTPFLELKGSFRNPLDAIAYLHKNEVDFLFLDINMPELTGLEFMNSLKSIPPVILTTAYSEYALESYEYNVVDYLLKPIPFPRFLKAVQKIIALQPTIQNDDSEKELKKGNTELVIEEGSKLHRIQLDELQYIEAMGNYLKFFTTEKTIVIKASLGALLDQHKASCLCRIHRSFAVNLIKVEKVSYNEVLLGDQALPVGRKYREILKSKFKNSTY